MTDPDPINETGPARQAGRPKLVGITRQIAFAMGAIVVTVLTVFIATSYVVYEFIITDWREQAQEGFSISWGEAVWMVGTTAAGVALAVVVAGHVARRILVPLDAVARGIQRLAEGDLSVRVEAGPDAPREAAILVEDFNRLAGLIENVTEERLFWNAAIAHELRTPVTILRGRLQGLADGVFEPDAAQFASLLRQVEGLGRVIEDLRTLSLVESEHLDLHRQDADLAHEIREAAEAFGEASASAGQQIVLDLSQDRADCDPVRIRQALLALLDNARRHAVPGIITVRTRWAAGQYALSVEDQGPGIAPGLLPHVFEAFRRSGNAETGRERGSGLGLAVVAAIAQAHGGLARCEALPSGGTRFELRWPPGSPGRD